MWANSPWQGDYHDVQGELHDWINDGLITVFFFVVGLEIKRELVSGELREWRAAALPAIAALGGMLVPATVFRLVAGPGPAAHGWGIPMATDIAFAVGVLAVLGSRVPRGLRVFVLTLAIVDDIGAIVVIAAFYTERLEPSWLLAAAGIAGATAVATRMQIGQLPAGVGSCHILGAAALGGIGFTVSLFITGLAYATPRCRHRPRSASWPGRCPPRCSGR